MTIESEPLRVVLAVPASRCAQVQRETGEDLLGKSGVLEGDASFWAERGGDLGIAPAPPVPIAKVTDNHLRVAGA